MATRFSHHTYNILENLYINETDAVADAVGLKKKRSRYLKICSKLSKGFKNQKSFPFLVTDDSKGIQKSRTR